ncbi:hypothetical protein [Brevifollis gellanilyticus]|uniref:SLA1 homology domain-containing protein n=1 Tax=Brevifollis gellanilyticus TaxID=748831 RepID=A0A512MH11_9BACT|nr:hypothetical protein [Brevifollis gellanilyticus]GEP46027.1 hypothetical protein BGE01nite_53180 [Brevifollis gellanilyticus]
MNLKLLPALVLSALTVSAAEPRVFTNTAGKQVKATLESVANGQATIILENGQKFSLAVTSLSAADQEYIKQQASAPKLTGKNDKISPQRREHGHRRGAFQRGDLVGLQT